MSKRDPQRTQKLRIAVRYLLERDCLAKGNQSRLAEHFHVSRQRVHQIVCEERERLRSLNGNAGAAADHVLVAS
jgi:DNA-directed RNA polymerase sigma subunit (sigma70/sigma32)